MPRDPHETAMQRALMQWKRPEKRPLVLEALRLAGREDLIGYGKGCLVRPERKQSAGRPEERHTPARSGGKGQKMPVKAEKRPPARKAGWAVPKPKKNAKPKKKR